MGFNKYSLAIILNYLKTRWQRVKINNSFSSWSELLSGVPQGSVLGPILFNLYINDFFFQIKRTHPCNFADDTSLNAFDLSLENLLRDLEYDALSSIIWFENNFMKLNTDKCHFLVAANTYEHLWIRTGTSKIWESYQEKLLGITIDKNLNFNAHIANLCKTANQKVSALARIAKLLPFKRKRILFKAFIESQFSYCPLVWMFCSRQMNRKINHVHERALRIVYNDYESSFNEILIKDNSVLIHRRNIQLVALEMYKIVHNLVPPFMNEIFGERIQTSNRSGNIFLRQNVNSVYNGENSLRIFGPIVWNTMLPERYKSCTSIIEFKNAIKSWIPNNCLCRLCRIYVPRLGFISTISQT